MSEKNTRLYEFGFILVPTIVESEVPAKIEALKAVITKAGGEITSEGTPEYIDLAYTMEKTVGSKKTKYSQGYFGFIKFTAAPETLEGLKKAFDSEADLVRYLLVKTSELNTIIFKKPKIEAKRGDAVLDEEVFTEEDDLLDEETVAAHDALPDLEVAEEPVEKEVE